MAGLFGMLSVPALLAMMLARAVPRRPFVRVADANDVTTPLQAAPSRTSAAVLFFGAISYYLAAGGVWPYMGQIGLSTRLSAADVAGIFAYSQVWGAVAALVPLAVGSRLGRSLPIAVSVGIGAACLLLLIGKHGEPWIFSVAAQAFMFGWLLFFPYLMGLTASIDRWAVFPAWSTPSRTWVFS